VKTIHIYILIDPRTDEIRYVGKTEQSINARINGHMQDNTPCHRVHWLNELKREGLKPRAAILVTIDLFEPFDENTWKIEEKYWIRKLKQMGARLTNNTIGGDGVVGLPAEARQRMRLTWLGRKHKPETIEKLKIARAKRVTSEETKRKMSESQKGRKITWGDALSKANRKITEKGAQEIKRRIENGELVTAIANELKIHRTTISKIKAGTYFMKYREFTQRNKPQTNNP